MKARTFWPLLLFVLSADFVSKRLAVSHLPLGVPPRPVLGDFLRLTLSYNRGAAMGLPLGSHVSGVLGLLGIGAAVFLFVWYLGAGSDRRLLGATLGLLTGGALGNAWQRLLSPRGVVDFIDVGVGTHRFWTFNVADSALTVGVLLLLLVFHREDQEDEAERSAPPGEGR